MINCFCCLIMPIIAKSLKKNSVYNIDTFAVHFTFYKCKSNCCLYLFTNVKKINVTFVN